MPNVPYLNAFSTGAAASYQSLAIGVHVQTIATSLHICNVMSHLPVAQVPQLHVAVPTTRIHLVRVQRWKARTKNFIWMALVLFKVKNLEWLKGLQVVEFNLSLLTGNCEAFSINWKVHWVVRILFVKHNLLACIGHLSSPTHDRAIETGTN